MFEREIIAFKEHFENFYKSQDYKTKKKIGQILDIVRFEKRIPLKFFKYLTNSNGIYEIRITSTFKNIRILCFFDRNDMIILCNCFYKKTHKTPLKEIRLAEKLREKYLNDLYER